MTPQERKEALLKADLQEIEKCANDLVYFYNKYVKTDGARDMTTEEYNRLFKQREGVVKEWTEVYMKHPLTPEQVYSYKKMIRAFKYSNYSNDEQVHVCIRFLYVPFTIAFTKGMAWFKIHRYGLYFRNNDIIEPPFSERIGKSKPLTIGRYAIKILKP